MRETKASPPAKSAADSGRQVERFPSSAIFSLEAWQQIAYSLRLSGRELEIVKATFDGKTESAMALDLGMAPSTIHTHIERLHHKLLVTDRAQLLLRITSEFLALTAAGAKNLPPICADHGTPRCPRCK